MCPERENLIKNSEERFEDIIGTVTYNNGWTYLTLETAMQSCSDFPEVFFFMRKLNIILHHTFIAQQQSYFCEELKLELKTGKIAVMCDFSENKSIIQDEAQCFHWNSVQSIFLSVCGLLFTA
jgi:hypothetical protein